MKAKDLARRLLKHPNYDVRMNFPNMEIDQREEDEIGEVKTIKNRVEKYIRIWAGEKKNEDHS